ncbi:radical SAM family heme chaperone HemW [Flammeovirga yaeyamensis]|uniref:Heme chaperone HemW n=1 Tax=Flammeovirga yaeyamensis TaxID=367791 RepID=A0AAX1MZL7_9BACT|nr:radical SAM family heme chaperone HemW [Flammeovirga yaeyamensis]MBB3700943.1 oxygen-independent coproporphyrinogen-3 oxidase [Flammeovirga yaeyamensis]NMF38050.1 radical SAM family heme chaperone HemW [Flammeovirga yaeyamensis]QWG00700.1 radical SAM family heme chaperone HemW [Flammeovirga yaeyamensis]
MSGIYFHIPFCKQACHYCDFHFSTSLKLKNDVVKGMLWELDKQKEYINENIETIYFGGGTPSILSIDELSVLLDKVHNNFNTSGVKEVTLEANPDDITKEKLAFWKKLGITRLSIGLQSFYGPHLELMNRAHNAEESLNAVKMAQDAGFNNLTIDLIYGIPYQDHSVWYKDLETALSLNVPHISSYCLTVEEKTALGAWTKKGKFKPAEDEYAAEQFEHLVKTLSQNGYDHYEISNFAKPGFYSQHNSAYWKGKPYLGIGPGAHSFNGSDSRQYNVSNNAKYVKSIVQQNTLMFDKEMLTRADGINEYILTTLRTIWGCDLQFLLDNYQFDLLKEMKEEVDRFYASDWIKVKNNHLMLTEKGKLFADKISSELFV